MRRRVFVSGTAALLLSACSSSGGGSTPSPSPSSLPPAPTTAPPPTSAAPSPGAPAAKGAVTVTGTVATGINVPWGLALLPDRSLLVSSRDTYGIHRVDHATGATTLAGTVPDVVSNKDAGGEAGLLGIALSPRYATDRLVYAYYSTGSDNRIARMTYDPGKAAGHQLGTPQAVLSGIPLGVHHNGGRIAFGPDGMLYAGTGETGNTALSQDLGSLGGKILRMTPDGKPPPAGNPFAGSVVYSYGHRNVQGLAWDPQGRLWASEFGDREADELNLILPGRNYGWPATQGRTSNPKYTSPVAQFGTEEDSPSGIAFAAGCVWMAGLKGERLWRIPLAGAKTAAAPASFLDGSYGRLRSVLADTDGTLLVTTSNTDGRGTPRPADDRILRLTVR
ncbi:sorbosone dehydrogenase family protein [Streptacidiphilus sp. N1-3]|uniref:Sorbosone dehydrogenase family protein n=1 Tax=Streptacidiphilus alkalitolerans TaxID=3342712 RepID=A0ABV6X7Y6_9ACTN